ncbi:[protein-PII] uridylyltransferase [Jiangella anatolica]|uniref:Bifunctional uridylyltransferase/uridylyl-removing enzyme n=1 Tax=Jiangella anatolica TaxID=2670374 RepID=A0A2W2B828_9ACTN|nr:[protein-PII] uridylyltransferase [Jiangella anatolica]PZF81280.1 [protein-PII] uridylyltransferase [Jiangella anatolica]
MGHAGRGGHPGAHGGDRTGRPLSTSTARFVALRRAIVDDDSLGAARRAQTLSELADGWLARLFADVPETARRGFALVAVGGYGRQELLPGSDLDVLLLAGRGDPAVVADAIFYPVWDAGLALDHSVRTPGEALSVAATDLKAALGLIDARHVAGDPALTDALRSGVRDAWRKQAPSRLPELAAMCRERAASVGELAHLLEPDLVQAHGGLRDTLALRAVTASWIADRPRTAEVDLARQWLLTVRDALHRTTGRRQDLLLFENQDDVAALLGLPDADALLRRVAEAGRSIAYVSDVTWRDVERTLSGRRRRGLRRQQPVRRPLADGVDEYDGEVVLARSADPPRDPVLPLRAAAAAAQAGLVPGPQTLARLVAECPPLPEPWPAPALDALVSLLGAGPGIVPVWDALEAAGLVVRWFPEWERIRYRATRTPVHRHTVDRHLVETALVASRLTRRVSRPDLLLLAALVHDLGKGVRGDHSVEGEPIAVAVGRRLGLPDDDAVTLGRLVRHHLLLPETATRRDPDDPATLATVVEAVGTREFLELLACLTEADATAAGPVAWTPLRSRLVGDLVERTRAVLAGAAPHEPGRLTDDLTTLVKEALADSGLAVRVTPPDADTAGLATVTVAAGRGPRVLGVVAGVLALHRLDVRSARAYTEGDAVVLVWRVVARGGGGPDGVRLREDIARALGGSLDLGERLAARAAEWRGRVIPHARPRVELLRDVSADATVLEVRAHDQPGLLHRLATALNAGVVIRSAVVGTLGSEAIDVFYLVDGDGSALDPAAEQAAVAAAWGALE